MLSSLFDSDYRKGAKQHFINTHQNPTNIALHHFSNMLVFLALPLLFVDWRISLVLLLLTQPLTIGGHLVFEKNTPAFVGYNNLVIILSSLSWSLENWFGLKPQSREAS